MVLIEDKKRYPLVSIIVPIFNSEKWLNRCIESILMQDYTNIEVILIDDGSTDNSGQLCDTYAAADNRIKVIHQPNSGVGSARNLGIDSAQGEYITFCDSDDELVPGYLSSAISDCVELSLDFWMGTTVRIVDGRETGRNEPWARLITYSDQLSQQELISVFNATACISGKMWRRGAIADVRFNLNNNFGEDLTFSFELMQRPLKMMALPKIVYIYHLQPTGLTGSISSQKCQSVVQTYRFLYHQLELRGYPSDGEFANFLKDRWHGDLVFMQTQVLMSKLTKVQKNELLDILIADKALYSIARKNGFLTVHPKMRVCVNYFKAGIQTLKEDGMSQLWERVKHFIVKRI